MFFIHCFHINIIIIDTTADQFCLSLYSLPMVVAATSIYIFVSRYLQSCTFPIRLFSQVNDLSTGFSLS
uniref:Putative secreted peptide n=1 Tax=Anopheles braziliensis TaxID=58242 RepID=A0A2M3ZRV7_9DIPT